MAAAEDAATRPASLDGVDLDAPLTLEDFDSPFFVDIKAERRGLRRRGRAMSLHQRRFEQVCWAHKREHNPGAHLTLDQVKNLRNWFDLIDKDGSGDISLMELADPLLTTGLANSIEECVELFAAIDTDGSGEIDFEEFLQLVAIKASGRLDRERRRREGVDAAKVAAEEKTRGILAVLEKLKEDEHNSLSLTAAVGIERRKYLLNAVMPELSGLRVHIERAKFEAIQNLLLAPPRERRTTLVGAAQKLIASTRATRFSAFNAHVPPPAEGFKLPPAPDMPWKDRASGAPPVSGRTPRVEGDPKPVMRRSKTLPVIEHLPPSSTVRSEAEHRAKLAAGARWKDTEALSDLVRELSDSPAQARCRRPIAGANGIVEKKTTRRAMLQSALTPFFETFVPESHERQREVAARAAFKPFREPCEGRSANLKPAA